MFRMFGSGKGHFVMLWAAIAVMASALTAQAQITGPCADTITKCCSDVITG